MRALRRLPALAAVALAAAACGVPRPDAAAAVAEAAAVSPPPDLASPPAPRPARDARPEAAPGEGAEEAPLRVVVSVGARRLWLLRGPDTLLSAPAGVGKGTTLRHGARSWTFRTPRGSRTVVGKEEDPAWVPPDWHFVEAARESGLALRWLGWGERVPLEGGGVLRMRGAEVVRGWPDGTEDRFPPGRQIVWDGVLYVPPAGSANRRVAGELGSRKLDLGDGYLIHGTDDEASVGARSTHGCIRLRDADLRALYARVPVGTPVEIR